VSGSSHSFLIAQIEADLYVRIEFRPNPI